MIKRIKQIVVGVFLFASLFSQESLFWEVTDPIVNSEFIEEYINRLIEVDKFEENSIQASFSIIVQMDVSEDRIELKKLKAKDYQMGQYISFDMGEVDKMHPLQLNTIMSREYKWKDVSRRDLSELEEFSTLDNVFKERSFKDARDAFWWSNSQISASTAMRFFIRQKSGSLAFRIEQGFSDLGISRQLSENLSLGVSNDIVSMYAIVPGNTMTVSNGIGHPVEGNLGFGFKFDTHKLGGQVNYMDIDAQEYEFADLFSRKHMVVPTSSGILYWSNTFQINRKVDSNYGTKFKDQVKQKEKAEKLLGKSKVWSVDGVNYSGLFVGIDDSDNISIQVEKDEKAHSQSEKGRDWTTVSGSTVKASLIERDKESITLNRAKDDFTMVLKIEDLSEEDKNFIKKLKWDGEKTMTSPVSLLSSEDQKLVRAASGVVKARKGKGRELKVSQPFASMRLKAGLSFAQFIHIDGDTNTLNVSDRVLGSDAIGIYAKIEGVTDNKKSKAYLQINVFGSGFKSYAVGIEHNVYRMFNLGMDCTLYPNNSYIEFQQKKGSDNKWRWYPGLRPDENGKGGGSFMISPYVSVNF